jgi:branched-chain amino acid transport system ATP-binding protein
MPMPDPLLSTRPLLSTKGLDAHYGDFQALFSVDINVLPGEVIAIIGSNGAGKTTLMRSITGLLSNAPDMVTYRGDAVGGLRADLIARKGIAMVPEGRQLFQSLSVEENLIIGGQMGRKGSWDLQKIFELFPILKERRSVPATALSGGQQQMVAIGRALMSNPDLILFDEISLGLAPIIIKSIYDAIPDIIGDGMSAIIVEQDIAKALSVAGRVYCMQEGRISLEGSSNELSREQISAAYFGV